MRLVFFFLISQIYGLPEPPNDSFEKKISISKKTVSDETGQHEIEIKKVFVKFIQGCYTFKKRREKAGRVTFTCNGCEKFDHYLSVSAWRERVVVDDPEHDSYVLDIDTLPGHNDHLCGASGIEAMVRNFRLELENEARRDPIQPFPTLYQDVR